jgi:anhydro-N-acetylmuramic acid kinase
MHHNQNIYQAIGLMSGTSMDGLDVVAVRFDKSDHQWQFQILASEVMAYDDFWDTTLRNLHKATLVEYAEINALYGQFLGDKVNEFIFKHQLKGKFDVIGSHGHTILHQPQKSFTVQVGSGAHLAERTKIPVVSDLRSSDVAAGGQGAPIVPIGEKYLFPECNAFLNIGGIANIALHESEKVIAYDVCPGNTPLNLLAVTVGQSYDANGNLARNGQLNLELFNQLNALPYYQKATPKSLHTDTILKDWMSVIDAASCTLEDKLHTVGEHIAFQIGNAMQSVNISNFKQLMITGGGAKNSFLVERIQALIPQKVVVPNNTIIDFKEALVMAFFAVLRLRGEANCLSSVTGANRNVCGGAIYGF